MRLTAVVLGGLLGIVPAAHGQDTTASANAAETSLTILSPTIGQATSGYQVAATLSLGNKVDAGTLQVLLNGKDVTERFYRAECNESACQWRGTLSTEEGLIDGENTLRASADGQDESVDLARVYFDYGNEFVAAGEEKPHYLPPAVGLQLTPGGGAPWIKISTGTPETVPENIDQTKYSTPYPTTSLRLTPPSPTQNCNNVRIQVAVLSRQDPTQVLRYRCSADGGGVKVILQQDAAIAKGNLVLVGTTAGHTAPADLDTTVIGGTDYSKTGPNQFPQSYAIIGVPGMKAGTAYESYNTNLDVRNAASLGISGLLVRHEGNYDFHPTNNQFFSISPNPERSGTSVIRIGTQSYLPLSGPAYENGIWMLVLDRVMLQPVSSVFLRTGSANNQDAADKIQGLTNLLNAVTPRQLVILTSVGQPLQNTSVLNEAFGSAIVRLGGSRFTLLGLARPGATYTLIAPGTTTNRNPFARQVVLSSSIYQQQGQTGYVTGILARDQQGLYAPLSAAQTDGQNNGDRATLLTPDQNFDLIATQLPADWPLTDTAGHMAAYHYASQWFLTRNYQTTGSHSADLRYFYPGKPILGEHNKDFDCSTSSCPPYPGDGNGFTQQDLSDANAALYKELTALRNTYEYLDTPGLGEMFSKGDNSVVQSVILAMHEVLPGDFANSSTKKISSSPTDWTNLLANTAAIAASAFTAGREPVVAGAIGIITGIMREGTAFSSMVGSETPPSYETSFETTLANLTESASKYSANLVSSYAVAMDSTYSDSGKLQAVFQKTSDSDSGWSIGSRDDKVIAAKTISRGVSRSLYLQLLPQFYSLDYFAGQPISEISKLGGYKTRPYSVYTTLVSCVAVYPSVKPDAYGIYRQLQGTGNNIFVLGGPFINQGTDNVSEGSPSQSLLNTLFSDSSELKLNFVKDYFFSSSKDAGGILQYRGGPDFGAVKAHGYCYKVGCSAENTTTSDAFNKCKGP